MPGRSRQPARRSKDLETDHSVGVGRALGEKLLRVLRLDAVPHLEVHMRPGHPPRLSGEADDLARLDPRSGLGLNPREVGIAGHPTIAMGHRDREAIACDFPHR